MNAFVAMLVDSYRQLNSRRLFWIILGLSALIVLYFASIGFDENGMSMFFGLWSIDNPVLTRDSIVSKILYRSIFSTFIVGFWLAWIATILALISTTTIFPDFIADGAIDLVLSKPISRVRLFAMKYLASLLFVLLQVGVFCVGIFFCMGLRLGDWEWKIFAAIPLVVLFYSYLFSVNVLVGVWTRSAMAALLATLLFWFSLFATNATEAMLNQFRTNHAVQIEELDESIDRIESSLTQVTTGHPDADASGTARLRVQLETMKTQRAEKADVVDRLDVWHGPTRSVQALMPKTSDTIALLDRWLRRDTDVNILDIMRGTATLDPAGNPVARDATRPREVERRLEEDYASKSTWYITGSSLAFEAVVLALACFVFVRRDY